MVLECCAINSYLEFVRIIFYFFNKFSYDERSEENIVRQVVADEHLQTQLITMWPTLPLSSS